MKLHKKSRYKHGKKDEPLPFKAFRSMIERARISLEELVYLWLLYYTGVRKSEAYELTIQEVKIQEDSVLVDFGKRKKGGAEVPPLELMSSWPGIPELKELALARKRGWPRFKTIYFQAYTEQLVKDPKTGKKKGKRVGQRASTKVKAKWLFPNIESQKAWRLVKQVLGPEFYPHYLRLNRITDICSDPTNNETRVKSFTGIKSLKTIQSYMGISEKEQKAALQFMNKEIQEA